LTGESLEILRFLAEHPETYDYFYNGKAAIGEEDNTVRYATEMIVNYMEHVVLQMDSLPRDAQKSWNDFVVDTYSRSPVIRAHLKGFKEWYSPALLAMVENVQPRSPST
jgi:hypothetical protein